MPFSLRNLFERLWLSGQQAEGRSTFNRYRKSKPRHTQDEEGRWAGWLPDTVVTDPETAVHILL